MRDVIGILVLVVGVPVAWFGLARAWLRKNAGAGAPRKVWLVSSAGVLACIGGFLVLAVVIEEPTDASTSQAKMQAPVVPVVSSLSATPEQIAQSTAAINAETSLGTSIADYAARFDAMAKESGLSYRLRPEVGDKSVWPALSVPLGDHLTIMIGVNLRNEVRAVTLSATADGTEETSLNNLDAAIVAMAAAGDGVSLRGATSTMASLYRDVMAHLQAGSETYTGSRVHNGVRWTLAASVRRGEVYTAEPAED